VIKELEPGGIREGEEEIWVDLPLTPLQDIVTLWLYNEMSRKQSAEDNGSVLAVRISIRYVQVCA